MWPTARGGSADLLAKCGVHLEQMARLMRHEATYAYGQVALAEERDELHLEFARSAAALSECLQLGSPTGESAREPGAPGATHVHSLPTLRSEEPCSEPQATAQESLPALPSEELSSEQQAPAKENGRDSCHDVAPSPTTFDTPVAFAEPEAPTRELRQKSTSSRLPPQQSTTLAGEVKEDWTKDQMVLRHLQSKYRNRSLRELEHQGTLQSQQCMAYRVLRGIVGNPRYEAFWAMVVLLNTVSMILEEERTGIIQGHDIGVYTYYGSKEYIDKWWPDALQTFFIVDCVFAAMFTIELILTFSYDLATMQLGLHCPYRRPFWREAWDILDFLIVCFSNFTLFVGTTGPVGNTRFLRIFRLVRLLRLVRLVRKVHSLDALHLMTTAIRGSVSALVFSMILLVLILTLFAMLLSSFLRDSYLGPDSPLAPEAKQQLYLYFGSYSRSMLSLFELALANWPQLCRFLMEEVHEGLGAFCICYKLSIGFAVIGVINGVFIQETFSVAAHDDFIMVRSRLRQVNEHKERISRLFTLADQDQDGLLTRSEVQFMMQKRAIRTWLEAMDVRCHDGDILFDLISKDGEGVTLTDFVGGIGRLKGTARTMDLIEVTQNQNSHFRHLISESLLTSDSKIGCKE